MCMQRLDMACCCRGALYLTVRAQDLQPLPRKSGRKGSVQQRRRAQLVWTRQRNSRQQRRKSCASKARRRERQTPSQDQMKQPLWLNRMAALHRHVMFIQIASLACAPLKLATNLAASHIQCQSSCCTMSCSVPMLLRCSSHHKWCTCS